MHRIFDPFRRPWMKSDPSRRLAAIEAGLPDKVLDRIIKRDPSITVRIAGLMELHSLDSVVGFAVAHSDLSTRLAAIRVLLKRAGDIDWLPSSSDHELVRGVVTSFEDDWSESPGGSSPNSPSGVPELLPGSLSPLDMALLSVVQFARNEDARASAARRVRCAEGLERLSEEGLLHVIREASATPVRSHLLELPLTPDQLLIFVQYEEDSRLQLRALARIDDAQCLLRLALDCPSQIVRAEAAAKVHTTAHLEICDKATFMLLAEHSESEEVRSFAASRLGVMQAQQRMENKFREKEAKAQDVARSADARMQVKQTLAHANFALLAKHTNDPARFEDFMRASVKEHGLGIYSVVVLCRSLSSGDVKDFRRKAESETRSRGFESFAGRVDVIVVDRAGTTNIGFSGRLSRSEAGFIHRLANARGWQAQVTSVEAATRESREREGKLDFVTGGADRASRDVVALLFDEVRRDMNAKSIVKCLNHHGFRFIKEDELGLWMECDAGTVILTVFASRHPTNIFALAYRGNGPTDETVHVVKEGRIVE